MSTWSLSKPSTRRLRPASSLWLHMGQRDEVPRQVAKHDAWKREQPHPSGSAIGSSLRSWQIMHWCPAIGVMEADTTWAGTGSGLAEAGDGTGVMVIVRGVVVVVMGVAGMATARREEWREEERRQEWREKEQREDERREEERREGRREEK